MKILPRFSNFTSFEKVYEFVQNPKIQKFGLTKLVAYPVVEPVPKLRRTNNNKIGGSSSSNDRVVRVGQPAPPKDQGSNSMPPIVLRHYHRALTRVMTIDGRDFDLFAARCAGGNQTSRLPGASKPNETLFTPRVRQVRVP